MKKLVKRFVSVLLVLCVLFSVSITASAAGVSDFSDVKKGRWSYDAVCNARAKGYVNGVGNNKFDPRGSLTIAQLSQVLYNMAGKPRYLLGDRKEFNIQSAWSKEEAEAWVAEVNSWAPDQYDNKSEPVVIDLNSGSLIEDFRKNLYVNVNGHDLFFGMTGKEWYAKAYVWATGTNMIYDRFDANAKATRGDVVRGLRMVFSRLIREEDFTWEPDDYYTEKLAKYGYTGGEVDFEGYIERAESGSVPDSYDDACILKMMRYELSRGFYKIEGTTLYYKQSTDLSDYGYVYDEYAVDGEDPWIVGWAIENHILAGNGTRNAEGKKNLNLEDNVTREEFAQFLYNYDKNIG